MSLAVVAWLLLQAARPLYPIPPPPPPEVHDWAALQPVEQSQRMSVLCRDTGRTTAEFAMNVRREVRMVDIEGLPHKMTPGERAAIDTATRLLGWLSKVSVGCNGPNAVVISVQGAMVEQNGIMMQKSVSISWYHDRIEGMHGRKHPWMELTLEQGRQPPALLLCLSSRHRSDNVGDGSPQPEASSPAEAGS